ncbi:MAG TPA: hypothetical protein VN033_03455 [Vulgatibacter sp.]|nr:hypothetical protein [Vulgatibacter sp.]
MLAASLLLSLALSPLAAGASPDARAAAPTNEDERARLEAELTLELGAASPPPDAPVVPLPPGPKILPDISLVGTFAAAAFTREPTLRLAAHEPLHDGPQLQEIELALQSNVDPFLRADVYFAITEEGLEVEEAYATTLALPWNLQARAGHFYAPFGRFNQVHFLEMTPFVDMPLPNRRFFGGEQLRGTGAEASVLLPLPFFLELRAAAITAGNEVSFGVEGSEIERATDLLGVARAMASFELADRLTLNVGASVASGPNATSDPIDEGAHRTDVYGGDLYLRLRDRSSRAFTALQSEFMYRRASAPGGRVEQSGVYAWLVRRFDAHWEAAVRGDLLPDGSEAGRPELEEELGPFLEPISQWRVGGAISWYPTEFQRLRLQVNHDSGIRARGGHARSGQEFFLQYQFVIGAHGAHPF